MAIYRRSYKPYTGALTPAWSRFLVLFRYSRKTLFRSKFQTALFVICFFFPLLCLGAIYLAHNAGFLAQMGVPPQILTIDNRFFFHFLGVQGVLAFLMTAFAGPGLISPDLANGALPLYFCRPFSRAEYVLGKSSVLGILLSEITWIPGLVWFALKIAFLLFVFSWSKGTLPRYRYDQLMRLGWKVFLPVSLGWLVLTAAVLQFGGWVPGT